MATHPLRLPMALTALRNLLSPPATRLEPAPPVPGARGHLAIDLDSCVFCGVCARRCPSGALDVSRAERRFSIEPLQCVLCGVCVEACAKKSLRLDPEPLPVQDEDSAGRRVDFIKAPGVPPVDAERPEKLPKAG